MVVVVSHYFLEEDEVFVRYRFKHEKTVRSVVEETARLACRTLTLETGYLPHVEMTKQLLWPNTLQIITRRDPVETSDEVEHTWAKVVELVSYLVPRAFLSNRFKFISILTLELVLSKLVNLIEHH